MPTHFPAHIGAQRRGIDPAGDAAAPRPAGPSSANAPPGPAAAPSPDTLAPPVAAGTTTLVPQLAAWGQVRLPPAAAAELQAVFAHPGPIDASALSRTTRLAILRHAPMPFAVLAVRPHSGLAAVFDLRKLAGTLTAEQQAALGAYVSTPGYLQRPPQEKAQVLAQLQDLFLPGKTAVLRRFHLPRPVAADSGHQPLTMSLESEMSLAGKLELLDYYAPDPSGKLDSWAMGRLLAKWRQTQVLHERVRAGTAWFRSNPDAQIQSLRWRDLSRAGRYELLEEMQAGVDPNVPLLRIDDARNTPAKRVLPRTFARQLSWEGPALGTAEVITGDKYTSLDQLLSDVYALEALGGAKGGYHVHNVVELTSPEDCRRLGPRVVGFCALQDLQLFAGAAAKGYAVYDHPYLETWKASGINDAVAAFAQGTVNSDAFIEHKFHYVGLRGGEGLYGAPNRVGYEIRGVPRGEVSELLRLTERSADLMTSHAVDQIQPPPWPWWNAGDPSLGAEAYAQAKALLTVDAATRQEAQIDFDTLIETAFESDHMSDPFQLLAPLWSWEKIPGCSPAMARAVRDARAQWQSEMLEVSASLSIAIEAGREIDSGELLATVKHITSRFFSRCEPSRIVDHYLDQTTYGAGGDASGKGASA